MDKFWHREEPREVRPFFESVKAEDALKESGIQLFTGGDTFRDSSFHLEEIDFQKLAPKIEISLAKPQSWMPDGLTEADLKIVLLAQHSFLKRSELLEEAPLHASIPTDWEIAADVLARFGGGRNLQLTLALCLGSNRQPQPGKPFMAGHWLSRKTFFLRTQATPALFDIRTRSDADWVKAGYPPKTLFAVEYLGGIATDLNDGSSVATVHLHEDAHNKMTGSSLGSSLQPLLAAEIILSILTDSLDDWKNSSEISPTSPLQTLLRQLSGGKPMSLEELKNLTNKPASLRALLQDRLSVVQAL